MKKTINPLAVEGLIVETQPHPTAHTENPTWITVYGGDEVVGIVEVDRNTYAVSSGPTDDLALGQNE